MTLVTTTLFNIFKSELIKQGHNEFIDKEGNLVLFDKEFQFTHKIMNYDDDVKKIMDYIFHGLELNNKEHDNHFKKMFLYRFINRQLNRQTIESFKMELMYVFYANEGYINRVYEDIENFILQKSNTVSDNIQNNNQSNESNTLTDNRQAFADTPQNEVNLDITKNTMQYATDNTISKNNQNTKSKTDGSTTGNNKADSLSYSLDELVKSSSLMEQIMVTFDSKCFLQIW